MDEHNDDLESEVHESGQQEVDTYPDTDDEPEEGTTVDAEALDEDPAVDEDPAEL
jgi:hypothetical protein